MEIQVERMNLEASEFDVSNHFNMGDSGSWQLCVFFCIMHEYTVFLHRRYRPAVLSRCPFGSVLWIQQARRGGFAGNHPELVASRDDGQRACTLRRHQGF